MSKKTIVTIIISIIYNTFTMGQSNPCTKFGVLVNGPAFTDQQKSDISDSLYAEYVRENIKLSTFNGSDASYDTYLQNGFKVISNLSWDGAGNFATNYTLYAQQINSVLAKYQPEIVVIENEELNPNFHPNTTAQRYVNLLMTASPLVHAAGLKICNGGIYGTSLFQLIYRDLYANFSPSVANVFGANTKLTAGQMAAAAVPNSNLSQESKMMIMDSVIVGIQQYCDYVNIHFYIDTLAVTSQSVWPEVQAYFKRRMNKECITNETCIRNSDMVHWVNETLDTYKNTFTRYVIWFSYDDVMAGARGLNDYPSGALRSSGYAFRNKIIIPNPSCNSTGINNSWLQSNITSAFPNPFSTQTTIHSDVYLENATLQLYNASGQKVQQISKINGQTIILQNNNFSKGLYVFRITQDNAAIGSGKLIIED